MSTQYATRAVGAAHISSVLIERDKLYYSYLFDLDIVQYIARVSNGFA